MSVTAAYAATHDAFTSVAEFERLVAFDVRLLVAIADRGGSGRTDELQRDMLAHGSAIRRSSMTLRARGLVRATACDGTPTPKRGVRARLTLTERGEAVAGRALERSADTTADLLELAS